MKKLSTDFLLSTLSILASFAVVYYVVLPSYYGGGSIPVIKIPVAKVYDLKPSKSAPGAFDFEYKIAKEVSAPSSGEAHFDIPIENFDDRRANLELEGSFPGGLSSVRDFWNYPVQENAYMKIAQEKDGKGEGNGVLKLDNDPNISGLVNCRANTNVTGYFKAYFEDVALGNGHGFDDPNFGNARRQAVCSVLQEIATLIKLNTTTVTPDILFYATGGNLPVGALAAASSYTGYENTETDNGALHLHILSHVDPTPGLGNFDAFVITNFQGVSWDVDSNLNAGTYSFKTVMRHEILHALGFRSLTPSVIATANMPATHTIFDSFMYQNSNLNYRFYSATTGNLIAPTGSPSPWAITNEAVYRGIKNIVGATPDPVRPVYSPTSWEQGSSLSHFDIARSNGQVYVMHPSIPTNTTRATHDHEKQVLCHLGYQVSNMTGCTDPTPFAQNDTLSFIPSTPLCVEPLLNDESFGGGSLAISSAILNVQVGDSIIYYVGNNCTGATQATAAGAHSFSFTSNAVATTRTIVYRNVSTNANRISMPGTIRLESCDSNTGNYICNGDFEDGIDSTTLLNSGITMNCNNSQVSSWCSSLPTADLFIRDSETNGTLQLDIPENFPSYYAPNGEVDTWNGEPNNRYVGFYNQHINNSYEGIQTKLKQPLTAGHQYKLMFRVYSARFGQNTSSPALIDVFVSSGPYPCMCYINTISGAQHISQVTGVLNAWGYVEIPFTAADDYTHLFINGSFDTLGDYYEYIDDVSLVEVTNGGGGGGGGGGISTASVSGTVYHDLNVDGIKQQNEPGLSGLNVGIFSGGSTIPLQVVPTTNLPDLGEYTFSNLSAGDYKVALVPETVYPSISEPSTNALLVGYAHAQPVNVPVGLNVPGNDFGVQLSNDPENLQYSNIVIKKALVDATLSSTDRNITFLVEVTNAGPLPVTNVLINDFIPSPLLFYTYTSTPPSTYDPVTGKLSIENLAVGQTVAASIILKVPTNACGMITNTATLFSLDQTDTNVADNAYSAQLRLRSCLDEAETIKK